MAAAGSNRTTGTMRSAPLSRSVFSIEGMHCGSCAAAVERTVSALTGVEHIVVNAATARASIAWNPEVLTLNQVFQAIRRSGFAPFPLAGEASAQSEKAERRAALKRIGIAGLGMMQTMMLVYALYSGGAHGVDAGIAQYLRLAGMLLATPVLIYSGAPFFRGALRDLQQGRLGMDVPVAVALGLAFAASVINTLRGAGEIYYDSVTMFIFLLSVGRFFEMIVRQRSLSESEALARSVPATATLIRAEGATERVPLGAVRPGDRLLVARGAIVPVDATLKSNAALLDESLLTGESRPVAKSEGGELLGGSVNTGNPIEILCRRAADQSALAAIVALLRRASADRPTAVTAAERAASLFAFLTLTLAALVALFWFTMDSSRVMTATLAVLVVTCPCALSLATPATFAAAATQLARAGLLVVRADALERLARIDTVVLDKTGTLTTGIPVASVELIRPEHSPARVLAIAAALERHSQHPLANAFLRSADPGVSATQVREFPGQGVEGWVEGRLWRLGTAGFVAELTGAGGGASDDCNESGTRSGQAVAPSIPNAPSLADAGLVLGTREGAVATIGLHEELAAQACEAVLRLQRERLSLAIASGDSEFAVRSAARALGVTEHYWRMQPQAKLQFVRDRQAAGSHVLMVGDGINDGPVLAAAYASCAMTHGSAIAQSAADLLVLNGSLGAVARGVQVARKARAVVRQNLVWAFLYNTTAVPLAAAGLIAPWIAALGMSLSSLAVVLNAARLARPQSPERAP